MQKSFDRLHLRGKVPRSSDRADLELQNKTGMASIGHVFMEIWPAEAATSVLLLYDVALKPFCEQVSFIDSACACTARSKPAWLPNLSTANQIARSALTHVTKEVRAPS